MKTLIKLIQSTRFLALTVSLLFVTSMFAQVQGLDHTGIDYPDPTRFKSQDWQNGIDKFTEPEFLRDDVAYPQDFDVGQFLSDNDNTYNQIWDPWLSKAAIHAVATTDDGDMLALAGGYLYDNQIHLYRWNYVEDRYDLVWEIGGGIFRSDVTSLAFTDSDYNNLTEIVAGGEDGRLYVFEQRHIYDPVTNMENQFDLVWTSPRLGRIFDVIVDDTDRDYRKDIIVGTGDTVRWYEVDTRSGYPFDKEHWINFREVASYQLSSQVTALGISDVNSNGLKEVAVGQRSGKLTLLENNGTTLDINGNPFPLSQDNSYRELWDSGNVIRRPISDMEGGDIDGDGQNELLISVQGQGAYILDTIDDVFGMYRLQREFETWEANPIEIYPLDVYTDVMTNSSSMFNGTYLDSTQYNVYYQNGTGPYAEPLNYSLGNFAIYPYSSYSVMNQQSQPDGRYTVFDTTVNNYWGTAWAVYDWGNDEEAAGNGIASLDDLIIYVEDTVVDPENLSIYLSQDGYEFAKVNSSDIKIASSTQYTVEVDPTLAGADWNYYRYMKFEVLNGTLKVDVFETKGYNKPIYDALSVEIGQMRFKGDTVDSTVGFIGTIDGAVLGVIWDEGAQQYRIVWDSWRDERWKLQKNIFDLELIRNSGRFPAWMYKGDSSIKLDLSGPLPDGGDVASYTAENFYNWKNENDIEIVVISTKGTIYVYEQSSPTATPIYNPVLTDMIFGDGYGSTNGIQDYIYNQVTAGIQYFTMSIVPVDTQYSDNNFDAPLEINPTANAFWLYLGQWNGSLGNLDVGYSNTPGYFEVDVSVWYSVVRTDVDVTQPNSCGAYGLAECTYFERFTNEFGPATLSNMELTGQLFGTFSSSTWMPKVASADFVGNDGVRDLVLSNGKLNLLESVYTVDSTARGITTGNDITNRDNIINIHPPTTTVYSSVNYAVKGDYFKTINEDSKGRQWTNPNPVNYDGDDDWDLILGFTRYSTDYFGFNKTTYGITYWENQGSRNNPVWVEKIKAVNNNDADSGFRSNRFTDPVLVYDNYNTQTISRNPSLGYHPLLRDDAPSRLFMFKVEDDMNIFSGKLTQFDASYDQPTSLLAATYPEVKRIDINLQYRNTPGNTEINYGFHVFETWDNSEELNDWTLSLTTADLDQDGNNEIIVGDFNNNIYVFENLNNNTFKRAYKSFDINRTIQTDQSPYGFEKFDGISGNFSRTLFDHVQYIQAGFDLNNNSLQEFIATTENMVFVFEATLSPTGLIRQDTYNLIAMIDMLDFPALGKMKTKDIKISALSWGDDLTKDGRRELIIAVSSALLVLEIDKSPFPLGEVESEFNYTEIFFGDSYSLYGLYDLPGNYRIHPELIINALLVEDLDNDGYTDLAIAGTDTSGAEPLWSGFVTLLEWKGSGFREMVDQDVFADTVIYNPISDLAVDDADYDGLKELLIAHKNGIDIYEFTGDNTLSLREVITSNPAYQLPSRYYYPSATNTFFTEYKDVIRDPNTGYLKMVYTRSTFSGTEMVMAYSGNDGQTWVDEGVIEYTPTLTPSQSYTKVGVEEPSLVYDNSRVMWLSFVERYTYNPNPDIVLFMIFVIKNPVPLNSKTSAFYVAYDYIFKGSTDRNPSPRLFNLWDNYNQNKIGIAFISNLLRSSLQLASLDITYLNPGSGFPNGIIYNRTQATWANGSNLGNLFNLYSMDIVQLDGGYPNNKYGVVFAGYPFNESKSLDLDLFYDMIVLNSTDSWTFNMTTPNRLFSSGMISLNPSIIQEQHTGNLLVTYEESTLRPYGGLWAVWSNDAGISWNGPYDMSHPLGLDMPLLFQAVPTKSKQSYQVASTIGYQVIKQFEAKRPVVVPGATRGFTMVYTVAVLIDSGNSKVGICSGQSSVGELKSYVACNPLQAVSLLVSAVNPWSNFTWYDVGSVSKIVVGDTDRDGRHEILAASENQAFLFEFSRNTEGYILHSQKWKSKEYERDLTGIAISDANGNGFPEIIIESDKGIVQSFEVTDTLMAQANIVYSKQEARIANPYSGSLDNAIRNIETVDLNNDGIEDIVYNTAAGQLVALNGLDYSILWSSGYTNPLNSQGFFMKDFRIIRDNATSLPINIALVHESNVTLFRASDGLEVATYFTGNATDIYITSIRSGDVIPGGLDELLIGLTNGTIIMMSGDDLSILWSYDKDLGTPALYFDDAIMDIEIGNYINSQDLQIAVINFDGDTLLFNGNGTLIWEKDNPPVSGYLGITSIDINKDGLLDIVAGDNITIAMDGLTGTQLWNTTLPHNYTSINNWLIPIATETVTYDINNDGVLDIIFGSVRVFSQPTIMAISGSSGEILWNYQDRNAFIFSIQNQFSLSIIELSNSQDALVFQSTDFYLGSGYTTILDPKTGIAIGALDTENGGTPSAMSYLGSDRPLIILGDDTGNITIYSIWSGLSETIAPIIPELAEQPFFSLGDEFTRRTEYLLKDITGDGVDDVFVVDDYFVGAADTFKLLEDPLYNETLWTVDETALGRFLGDARFVDVIGSATPELVAAFNGMLIAIDIFTGDVVIKLDYNIDDDLNRMRNFDYKFINVDSDPEMEILYKRDMINGSIPMSQIAIYDAATDSVISTRTLYLTKNTVINVGDFDLDGTTDIVFTASYAYNPLISFYGILTTDLNFAYINLLTGLPPINNIAVGDFDSNTAGEEFIFFFEFSKLSLPAFLYNLFDFPTLFVQFNWNGTAIVLPTSNILGFSPFGGITANYWTYFDGSSTYLIGQSKYGDLFNFNFSNPSFIMKSTGEFNSVAVPYTRNGFLITDFCGANSFIALTASNSFSCYSSLNFTDPVPTIDFTLDFDVIQTIIPGDLDTDSSTDLLIASFTGYVWVYRSNPPITPILELNALNYVSSISNNDTTNQSTLPKLVLVVSVISISLMILILRRKGIKKIKI